MMNGLKPQGRGPDREVSRPRIAVRRPFAAEPHLNQASCVPEARLYKESCFQTPFPSWTRGALVKHLPKYTLVVICNVTLLGAFAGPWMPSAPGRELDDYASHKTLIRS